MTALLNTFVEKRSCVGVREKSIGGEDGWEFIKPVIDADAWAAFRGLLAFATWTAAHATERSFTVASKSGHGSVGAA